MKGIKYSKNKYVILLNKQLIQMPMLNVYTNESIYPKNNKLKDEPKKSVIDFVVAFSKSLEVKKRDKNNLFMISLN